MGIKINCPNHDDKNKSAILNSDGTVFCFSGCGLFKVNEDLTNCYDFSSKSKPTIDDINNYLENLESAKNNKYLIDRGIDNSIIEEYDIKVDGEGIVFPFPQKPQLNMKTYGSFQKRLIEVKHKHMKYVSYGYMPSFYPHYKLLDYNGLPNIVLVEGVFGVYNLRKYNINAFCIFGKSTIDKVISEILADRFKPIGLTISVYLDKDAQKEKELIKYRYNNIHIIDSDIPADEIGIEAIELCEYKKDNKFNFLLQKTIE